MTRIRVCDGWAVCVDGRGQVPAGTVVDVPDETAAWWVGRGWVELVPETGRRPSGRGQASTQGEHR